MDISEATWFLRAAGKRITPERRLLLRIISENAHLDASEIYDLAKEEDPRSPRFRPLAPLKSSAKRKTLRFSEARWNFSNTVKECRKSRDLKERSSPREHNREPETLQRGRPHDRPAGSPTSYVSQVGFNQGRTIKGRQTSQGLEGGQSLLYVGEKGSTKQSIKMEVRREIQTSWNA